MNNKAEIEKISVAHQQNIIIYTSPDGKASVALYTKDGTVWMNQKQIAELFATSVPNVSMHISNLLEEKELDANSVIKDYLKTHHIGN
ncbi:DNA-binding protein [Sedimentisphaera salicampi]|uniref:Virulence protein n=1 Tax=Sedimentisphaera salicampi TaxID=1941349 RepID=A0A1W6LL62_9BACT|nr:DNA-binding protein [Sedimentisphaera salicampi]ARN56484.1 Virulence protein [Sedimentisphaera salicampi]